ncbi:MAG: hypothetical protein JNM10_10480 [Planctomycetia bacterium]|nr:hypothetical protein [Planctomycetia bacterium]
MPPRSPALARIVERLSRLRARVRRIFAVAGLGRLLAWTAGCVAAWFLADLFLDLPLGVRRFVRLGLLDRPADLGVAPWLGLLGTAVAFLGLTVRHGSPFAGVFAFATAGVPGVLAWVAARHLWAPLRIPLPDAALALSVEARFRGLEDRLAAALDFDREIAAPTRGESPAMMARVVDEAGAEADRLEFATVASARSARRAVVAGLGAAAAAAVVFLAFASDAGLWARRALALEDVPWPRRTTLVAVVVDAAGTERVVEPGTPYVAALGQSLVVLGRAMGRVPTEVEIVDRVGGAGGDERPLAHRMRPVADRPGLFEHEFRDVRSDFTFSLRGGDDDDGLPSYTVVVRVPPRVTALRADLVYPAYLGLAPRRVEGGTVQAPAGTKVTVAFSSDAGASNAGAAAPTGTGGIARAEAFVGDAAATVTREGDTFRFAFDAETSTRYRLRIVTADGRENDPAADTYDVTVDPDTPPRPDWVFPRGGGLATTANGRIPLFLDTVDDHGIASLRLEVLMGAAETPVVVPLAPRTAATPDGANDRAYGAPSILSYHPLEVASLVPPGAKLPLPTRVQVRAVATDAKGQEAAGPWVAVDVLQPDEVERGLATQRSRAKTDVEAVRDEVVKLEATLADLAAQGALTEADRGVLRDVQFRAGKARNDLDRAGRAVTSVFTTYAYGRLGAEAPTATILALFDRRHRATFTRTAEDRGARDGGGAASTDDGDVFPWAAFREVVAARRDRVLFDTAVIDKIVSVLEHLVEAAAVRGPAAHELATRLARDGAAADVASLRASVTAWRAAVDATVAAMAEWQSLAELTLFVRRLVEEQERIDRDLKSLDGGGAKPPAGAGGR